MSTSLISECILQLIKLIAVCRNRSDLYDYGQISDYFSQNGRILVGFNQKRSEKRKV